MASKVGSLALAYPRRLTVPETARRPATAREFVTLAGPARQTAGNSQPFFAGAHPEQVPCDSYTSRARRFRSGHGVNRPHPVHLHSM